MRRTERLINLIIALLETRRPMTAEEIRSRVGGYDQATDEAFRRAFERDKHELRGLGIPLEVRKVDPLDEHSDGYLIPKDRYYLPDLELEPEELAALRIASEAAIGGGGQAQSGFLKLSIDSANAPQEGPRVVWGADLAVGQPLLATLYEAQIEHRPVRFAYVPGSGERAVRTVEPYGLVNRRGHWYLVGRDVDRAAQRSFRVSRIDGDAEMLQGSFEIPADFDAHRRLPAEAWEIGESTARAVVRFDADMRWWVEQNMSELEGEEGPEGSLDVTLPAANLDALVSWIIGFGPTVTILEPPEARARILEHLRPLIGGRGG